MVMWQHQCNQSWRDHTYLYFYFFLTKTAVKSKWNKQISYFREMYISRNLLIWSSQRWWSHQCLPGMTRDIWMRLAGPSSSSSSWTIINSYFSYPANWISYYFANKVGKCCWTGHCIFLVFSTVFLGPVNMIHCVIKRAGMLAWNDTRHLNAVGQLIIHPPRSDPRIMLQSFALFVRHSSLNRSPAHTRYLSIVTSDPIPQLVALNARKPRYGRLIKRSFQSSALLEAKSLQF